MSRWVMGLVAATLVAACGGDDDDDDAVDFDAAAPVDAPAPPDPPDATPPPDSTPLVCDEFGPESMGTNPGFIRPTEITRAYTEVGGIWVLQGNANWSCLCDGADDTPTTVRVILTGETRDFQTSDIVDNVDIAMLTEGDPLTATPIATTTSDFDGKYSLSVPTGTGRVTLVMTDPEAGTRFLDSINFHYAFEPDVPSQVEDLFALSLLTANALPAFIGVMRTPGLGLMSGRVVDCDGNEVDGAIATVSATPRTTDHLTGADTYYFSAGSTSLPVRHSQAENTNHDGLFVVIELTPATIGYVQAWGYIEGQTPGVDDLTLLSEVPVPVAGDTWGNAVLESLRQ